MCMQGVLVALAGGATCAQELPAVPQQAPAAPLREEAVKNVAAPCVACSQVSPRERTEYGVTKFDRRLARAGGSRGRNGYCMTALALLQAAPVGSTRITAV